MGTTTLDAQQQTASDRSNAETAVVGGGKAYLLTKRFFDIVMSALGMVLLLIPMLIIAAMVKLDSEGPAIFRQERLGLNGKPFMMYKFRSMYEDAETEGPKWAERNDVRCTRLGKILRKTRLDELPQLYNIFIGDMSIVGPRPERACFYDEFEKYIPHFRQRLLVQPGLTGHAQVNGGYELGPEEKIVFDLEYMRRRSFLMDMQCIWKTVLVVLKRDGAR